MGVEATLQTYLALVLHLQNGAGVELKFLLSQSLRDGFELLLGPALSLRGKKRSSPVNLSWATSQVHVSPVALPARPCIRFGSTLTREGLRLYGEARALARADCG